MQKPEPIDPFRKPTLAPGEKPDAFYRAFGGLMIAGGGVLGKFFVWDVLEAARRDEEIRIYSKAVFLTAMVPMMGLLLLVLGAKSLAYVKLDKKKLTAPQVVFLLVAVGCGFALDFWLKGELGDLGYTF